MGCHITGAGIISALGQNIFETGENLYAALHNSASARHLHPDALDFPFFPAIPGRRRNTAKDTLELAKIAANEAIQASGWKDLKGCAIVVGTTSGTALHFLKSYKNGKSGDDVVDYLSSNPAMTLRDELGSDNLAITISNACTSGTDAIGLGMILLECGQASRVLCGGADAFSLVAHTGFCNLKLASREACKPFDMERNGLNLGEGAAFVCLEKNPASALGTILGYSSHCDAWHLTAPHPEGRGLKKAIRDALHEARISPDEIAFVNAHATGTIENDRIEGKVLKEIFPESPIWASKGYTGHALGAAGAIEVVLTLLALSRSFLPGSPGFSLMDEAIGLVPVISPTPVKQKTAISTSLGFGGNNSAIVIGVE